MPDSRRHTDGSLSVVAIVRTTATTSSRSTCAPRNDAQVSSTRTNRSRAVVPGALASAVRRSRDRSDR